MKEIVALAVTLLSENAGESTDNLVDLVEAQVGNRDLAYRLVELIPVVYGRVSLEEWEIDFAPHYRRRQADGSDSDLLRFDDDELWEPIQEQAREDSKGNGAMVDTLAKLSSEADSVLQAIAQGVDVKGGRMGPLIFVRS